MLKKIFMPMLVLFTVAIGCDLEGYVENITGDGCIPEGFSYNSSTQQGAYFFLNVAIDATTISSNDWVGAFNGEVCVGARKWDTTQCGNGVCEVPVLGQDSQLTQGYMLPGVIPTFKIFRASDLKYLEAIPSQNEPWFNFNTPVIDLLYVDCDIQDCSASCLGDNTSDCAGICGGDAFEDDCGICDNDSTNNNIDIDNDGICDNIDLCIGQEDINGECILLGAAFPIQIILKQNYPNPFNPITYLEFQIDEGNHTRLTIYDINGKPIKKIVDSFLQTNSYRFTWDGQDDNNNEVPSGVYIASLESNQVVSNKKLTLIK
jgi:hypothetical protein